MARAETHSLKDSNATRFASAGAGGGWQGGAGGALAGGHPAAETGRSSRTLATLRDTLLLKLLSGEIQISTNTN